MKFPLSRIEFSYKFLIGHSFRSPLKEMSFFGFDSSLPTPGSQLEERLATYEETDIYDFGGDAYHELLAAKLDEGAINDFNDETFGAEQRETAPIGQFSRLALTAVRSTHTLRRC